MVLFSRPPRAVCVLRLSAIGDVCHTLALVQALQREWPSTTLVWVMGKVEASLFGDLPNVEVIVFDKKQGWKAYLSVWRQLRGRRFDALLQVQAALRASVLSLGIRARYRLGFDAQRANDAQGLFTNVKVPSPAAPHVVDGLMAFAQVLGVQDLTPRWDVTVDPADQEWAAGRVAFDFAQATAASAVAIASDSRAERSRSPTLIIVPASSKAYKNWTVAGYAALADHAVRSGWQVILCGSPAPNEQALGAQVVAACQVDVLNLVGSTSLKQMLALIQQAQLVVAPDSGPIHLATLVGTPVIGLYAHHNPARVGAYNGQADAVSVYQTLVEAEYGKPLAALPWRTRVKDKQAMQHISIASVLATFDQVKERIECKR